MQSFDYISEKLGVDPTLDPFLGICRTLRADLRTRIVIISRAYSNMYFEEVCEYEYRLNYLSITNITTTEAWSKVSTVGTYHGSFTIAPLGS